VSVLLSNCTSEATQIELTHCNPENLRLICFVVVSIERSLSKCKCSTNGDRIFGVLGCSRKVGVDMVHRRYDSADTWRVAREKECRVLEDLRNNKSSYYLADY
jgi:hypothetical protein